MRRFPEWPLLAAGVAIAVPLALLGRGAVGAADAPRPAIVVTRTAVERLREARLRESGPATAPPSERALVDEVVDEEILWREGRALLEAGDPVVRRRVEALRASLAAGRTGESDGGDAEGVAASADGLARTDLVLRRYAIEAARLALAGQGSGPPPSDAEADARAAGDPARFARPARLRFEHVFFGRDRHAASLEADAAAMLRALSATGRRAPSGNDVRGEAGPAVASAEHGPGSTHPGDPFPAGASFAGSPAEVDRVFGPGFAERVAALPRGAWSGPVASPFGLHVVRLAEASAPGPARPESVRSRAALALRREAQERRLRERLAELRSRYEVRVEGVPADGAPPGSSTGLPSVGS